MREKFRTQLVLAESSSQLKTKKRTIKLKEIIHQKTHKTTKNTDFFGRPNTQHNDIQHYGTQHKRLIYDAQHNNTAIMLWVNLLSGINKPFMLSVFMPNVVILSVVAPFWGHIV
jgi:hypothetical protein